MMRNRSIRMILKKITSTRVSTMKMLGIASPRFILWRPLSCIRESTLRKPNSIILGPQYKGSSISRGDFASAENSDEPGDEIFSEEDGSEQDEYDGGGLGSGDGSKNDENTNSVPHDRIEMDAESESDKPFGSEDEEDDMEYVDSILDDESNQVTPNSSLHNSPSSPTLNDRTTLREMMAESQRAVVDTISKAAKADLAKGKAIKHQRTTFDALLNTRIRLQKALVATNSLSSSPVPSKDPTEDLAPSFHAAEAAALNLWARLDNLLQSLQPPNESNPNKRPFSATHATPTPAIWSHMQAHDSASLPARRATLTKWSNRLQPALPLSQRSSLSTPAPPTPLTSLLDQHLSAPNAARLLARTRTPRSCAPLQAAARTPLDVNIYDDADFYTQLLRELVEQRMADSTLSSTTNPVVVDDAAALIDAPSAVSRAKVRKIVDTKASKGRKMRYTVHEKLQNFMPPEDRGTWGDTQARELFAGLLGRKVVLEEKEGDGDYGSGEEGMGMGMGTTRDEAALMLFRR